MPKFGTKSIERLNTCHPDLIAVFNEVIKYYDCTVTCGYRGEEDQNKAFDEGRSNARYPKGKHNNSPSTAVDIYPYPVDFENYDRLSHFAGFVLGIANTMGIKLRWGRDWHQEFWTKKKDTTKLMDYPHFELVNEE